MKNHADEINNLFDSKELNPDLKKEKNLLKLKKEVLNINMFSFSNNKEKFLEIFNCLHKCYNELLKLFSEKKEKFGFEKKIFKNNFDYLNRFIEEVINSNFKNDVKDYIPKDVYNILYKENIEKLKNDLEIKKNDLEKYFKELSDLKFAFFEQQRKIVNFENVKLEMDLEFKEKIDQLEIDKDKMLQENEKLKLDLKNSCENENSLQNIINNITDVSSNIEEQNRNLKITNLISKKLESEKNQISQLTINFEFEIDKKDLEIKELKNQIKNHSIKFHSIKDDLNNRSINSFSNRSILSSNKKKKKINKEDLNTKNRINELKEEIKKYKLILKELEKSQNDFKNKINDRNCSQNKIVKKLKENIEYLKNEKLELVMEKRKGYYSRKNYLAERTYWFLGVIVVLIFAIWIYLL